MSKVMCKGFDLIVGARIEYASLVRGCGWDNIPLVWGKFLILETWAAGEGAVALGGAAAEGARGNVGDKEDVVVCECEGCYRERGEEEVEWQHIEVVDRRDEWIACISICISMGGFKFEMVRV